MKLDILEDLRNHLDSDPLGVVARLGEDDGLAVIEDTLEVLVKRGGPGASGLHAALGHVIMSRLQRGIAAMEQDLLQEADD